MKNKSSGGYVAILILFIGVVVIIFLMVQQYTNLAVRNESRTESVEVGQKSTSPIDKALDAKNMLESRDQSIFNQ